MFRKSKKDAWVALADAGKARLLYCTVVPPGRCHVEETARLANNEEGHEHGRPSSRVGKSGQSAVSHEDEEQLRRFAKQTATWLSHQAQQHQFDELTLFAAPRLLGVLRTMPNSPINDHVKQHEADLTNLDNTALSEHPLIRDLLPMPKA